MSKAMIVRLITALVLITPVVLPVLNGGGAEPPGVSWT
jgi:hypothetical protein